MKNSVALPEALIANFPTKKVDPVPETQDDPSAYQRNPVTSAHAIDTAKAQISTLDSVAVSPTGSIVHGKYGDLGPDANGVPLEYLALLRMAAEGVAGLRAISEKAKGSP